MNPSNDETMAPAVVHLPASDMVHDLDAAMDPAAEVAPPVPMQDANAPPALEATVVAPPPATSAVSDFSSIAEDQTKRGKKNARFGRNPDGTPAKKADKKDIERKSEWGRFLHQFKTSHPEMHSLEATIEARKVYIPQSGKQKSFERIYTEVWKVKNPRWQQMSKEQRVAAIRADFIKLV